MRREPFYEMLGRRIARFRAEQGLSQQALGARMDPPMTRASIANIESGQQRVLAHALVRLATVLKCDLEALARPETVETSDDLAVQEELQRKLVGSGKLDPTLAEQVWRELGFDERGSR